MATLTRMANAFFTALPGAGDADPAGALATAPSPQGVALPDVPLSAAIPDIPALNVPAPAAGAGLPSSPFYFLEYAGSGWDNVADSATQTLNNLAALTAQSAALPAGIESGALRGPAAPLSAVPGGVPSLGGAPGFYFLDSALPKADARALQGVGQHPPFNVAAIRRDFPILSERVNGRPLIWLDNAATTQKPQAVIDRLVHFYSHENSNIHRAAHELAARATDAYEGARATVQRFLGASSPGEIVFVRGADRGGQSGCPELGPAEYSFR